MTKGHPVLQGTLDLLVLKTLEARGPLHGYGIARQLERMSGDAVHLNPGTIYASVVRLRQDRSVQATWGTSVNHRRARFYAITASGRKQLANDTQHWARVSGFIARVLALPGRAAS